MTDRDRAPVIQRGPGGHWPPGVSGNPSGRAKGVGEIRELARQYVPAALAKIAALVNSEDEKVALAASVEILNRVFGRPVQAVETETVRWDMASLQHLYLEAVKLSNERANAAGDVTPAKGDAMELRGRSRNDGEGRW
jgi:hypothetical protein